MDIDRMVGQINELMAFKERAMPMLLSFEVDRKREEAAKLDQQREEDEKREADQGRGDQGREAAEPDRKPDAERERNGREQGRDQGRDQSGRGHGGRER
jgi:hypothetical protein